VVRQAGNDKSLAPWHTWDIVVFDTEKSQTIGGRGRCPLFPPIPFYFSTSADADQNGNGVIDSSEAFNYPPAFAQFGYQALARGKRVNYLLGEGGATSLLTASVLNDPEAQIKNDVLVSIYSARYPPPPVCAATGFPNGFVEIMEYIGGSNGRNHSTIRKPDVAGLVFQQILSAQSQQQ
jgi:hypothetical protein